MMDDSTEIVTTASTTRGAKFIGWNAIFFKFTGEM